MYAMDMIATNITKTTVGNYHTDTVASGHTMWGDAA